MRKRQDPQADGSETQFSTSRSVGLEWGKSICQICKFKIGDERAQYRLDVGSYSGTAKDSLSDHNNMAFSTKDRDNDRWSNNCAVTFSGAWRFKHCHQSNLNGKYLGEKVDRRGVTWYYFKETYLSLKFAEMKLRPAS